ncbi:SDR family oxidoreductase [Pseudomonas syringae]|uniref:SDR family oxidoreductase n=1 Tax=Pseudomonas syringae TaxID=317 RepID=UPI00028CCA35|nr:SDR family oxidoreductase [Pseudomonas syringae]EKG35840.1 short-chain dehydrogenase/reductase SDR [Pseudomonas syringae pv. avellanae str. ISPaVe037]
MTGMNCFITGTSSGLGRELTAQLLEQGERVFATVRRPAALDDLKARYGDALQVAVLDVTDSMATREVLAQAVTALGRIDVLVSNAGYGLVGAAEEVTDDQILRQIQTNLIGSISVIRAAIPALRAQGGGRILQVSSEGGQLAYPGFSLYHATKWGIEGFVEAVSQEVLPFNIEFTLVEPGPARTAFKEAIDNATPMEVYEDTPVGVIRRGIVSGAFVNNGDPRKMARAMIDSLKQSPAPLRLTLGSSSYHGVRAALKARLAQLEANKAVTLSTDVS